MNNQNQNQEELKEQLAEMSGETDFRRPVRYTVPIISLNGNTGKFKKKLPNDDGNWVEEELDIKEVNGVVLKIRRILSQFSRDVSGKNERLFTNEHNSWRDKITLFETKDNKRPQVIDEGTNEDIRQRNQGLKVTNHVYFLMNNQIVKLVVRGSSLGNLYEYYDQFKTNEHIFEFVTNIIPEKAKNESLGTEYFTMKFTKKDKVNLEEIAPKIKEVNNSIKRQDDFYKQQSVTEEGGEVPLTPISEPESPKDTVKEEDVIDIDEEEKRGVNVDDIPF